MNLNKVTSVLQVELHGTQASHNTLEKNLGLRGRGGEKTAFCLSGNLSFPGSIEDNKGAFLLIY